MSLESIHLHRAAVPRQTPKMLQTLQMLKTPKMLQTLQMLKTHKTLKTLKTHQTLLRPRCLRSRGWGVAR
ncbi:MAG TPA: hypothetical protein VMS56_07645 [Thermoanaerobaculia bacterium]|nr:hypothetical protein [Thermoanaerobaculia bacterium]